jgi:hypothetical protein
MDMNYMPDVTYTIEELHVYAQRHGYTDEAARLKGYEHGKAIMTNGKAAYLLSESARAVRIAASKLHGLYGVPSISAEEQADYASELATRLLGDNGGRVPEKEQHSRGYMVRRAQGLIMNDRERRGVDLTEPSTGEAGADPRLTGPVSVPADVEAVADRLPVSETAKRALIAAMVPATRSEWAAYYGYATPKSWHITANRGRAELYSIGEGPIRAALAEVMGEDVDAAAELSALMVEV